VFKKLKLGNETLKELNSQMNLDAVEDLLLETTEAVEHQRVPTKLYRAYLQEIDALLAGRLTEEDEEDVLRELEELTRVSLSRLELTIQEPEEDLELPEVPSHPVKGKPTSTAQEKKQNERQALYS
jgi:charged multivesicular body protein 6